jgi:ubiquinone/menaquinone biosynthesis C-methylase UbiE
MHDHVPDEYETLADQYDTSFQLAYRTHVEEYSVMTALADVGGVTERHVLDVACGTGHYARQFRRAGAAQVVGVDLSAEMIRVAQQAEADDPLGALTYHVADAGALARYGTFDLAVAVYLFHYAQSQEHLTRMCQGIAQNLRSGERLSPMACIPTSAPIPTIMRSMG